MGSPILAELIGKEVNQYIYYDQRLEELIEQERRQLEEYAKSNSPKPAYIARMNKLLLTTSNFVEASDALMRGFMTAGRLVMGSDEHAAVQFELKTLRNENDLLKRYLKSLGKDPDLVRYMKISDFYV